VNDREALELECQLRFIDFAGTKPPDALASHDEPIDIFIEGFWEGVRAVAKTRTVAELKLIIDLRRRQAGITK
jgi:hypothetical protein